MALNNPTSTSVPAAHCRNTVVGARCVTRPLTVLVALAILVGCSSAIPPKPDFLMEFKNVGFCPGDDTRSRIQNQISSQVAAIKDPDVATFLSGVTVEDNVADLVGMCPNGVCQCPAGSYRLGIWRNNLDATGAFMTSSSDRKSALKDAPDLVPDQHAFSVLIEQRFLDDLLAFKWNKLPKRWSRSGKPAADGDIELLTADNQYTDELTSVLTIEGLFHAVGGLNFSIIVTDRLGKTNDTQNVTCETSKRVVDDTGVIGALLEAFFPFPFWWAREVNNADSLADLFGITDGYNKALAKLPAGLICTAVVTLPSNLPLPKNTLGVADKLSFQYDQIRLGAAVGVHAELGTGLFAAGQLSIAPREPNDQRPRRFRFRSLVNSVRACSGQLVYSTGTG
jgi:hypothetical protein